MRNLRRWVALMGALVLVLAACGDGDTAATDPTDGTDGTETTGAVGEGELDGVELQLMGFSSSPAEDEALTALIEQFNTETGANATFNPVPDYDTTLQAALAGGEPPDVFYVDSLRLPDLAAAGALQPVPEGAISDPDDIYPSLREAFTYEGTWYCPPKDFSTLGLVYDPAVLEAAGVEVPTTWEELRSAAETLTTEGQAGLVMGVEYPRWGVFMFQNGTALTDEDVSQMTLDNPESIAALEYIADLYQNELAVSPTKVDAGWAGEAFGQGKAAMTIEGNWIAGAMDSEFPEKEWAVAPLPEGPAGPGTFAFTVCYGVAANAANPDASWALVEYLTNADGSLAWTNAFNVMPARASVRDQWLEGHPELAPFLEGADYAHPWQFVPQFGDVLGVFTENAQAIVDGGGSVDVLVEETTAAGEDVLGG